MGVIVDTSVFVDFMKKGNVDLHDLLEDDLVVVHPFVVSEILLGGSLKNRVLHSLLMNLPLVGTVKPQELDRWIQEERVYKFGIGLVDSCILLSAIEDQHKLFTLDKKLKKAAAAFRVVF